MVYLFVGNIHALSDLKLSKFSRENILYSLLPLLSIFLSNFFYRKILQKALTEEALEKKLPFIKQYH